MITRERIEALRTLAQAVNGEGYYVQEDSDLVWRLPIDAKGPRRDDFLDRHEREYADAVLQPTFIIELLTLALEAETLRTALKQTAQFLNMLAAADAIPEIGGLAAIQSEGAKLDKTVLAALGGAS